MIFSPILGRELRGRARAQGTYWTRCGIGLTGILICVEGMGLGPVAAPVVAGPYLFNGIVGAAFLVSCGGCLLTADAISGERREGTMALLFLTRVKAIDLLIGKLGSIGIASLWSLVAFLPVLVVPVLAGGVTGGDAFRKGLVLMDTLFFALAAGLWSSAGQEERFRASRKAVLVVGLVAILPIIPFVLMPRVLHGLGLFSPAILLVLAGDIRYHGSPALYWISLLLVHALGWLLLVGAGIRLRRALRSDDSPIRAPSPKAPKEPERTLGLGSWQPVKEEASPIEWVVYRRNGVSAGLWLVAVLGLAYHAWVSLARHPAGLLATTSYWLFAPAVGTIAGLVGGALVAWVASRFFVAARRNGDLELLMTTPLGAETVLSEQWTALRRIFVLPVLVMQAPILPQLLEGLAPTGGVAAGFFWPGQLSLTKLLGLVNTYFGIEALCWLGLWFAIKARTQTGAILWTVGLGKGLPGLVSLVCSVLGATLVDTLGRPTGLSFAVFWWFPEVINLVLYLLLIRLARSSLPQDLVGIEAAPIAGRIKTFFGTLFDRY